MGGGLGESLFEVALLYLTTHLSFLQRVSHFAEMYAKKLGINAQVLKKTLWGDFYLNSKTKRIFKGAQVSLTSHYNSAPVLTCLSRCRPRERSLCLSSSSWTISGLSMKLY